MSRTRTWPIAVALAMLVVSIPLPSLGSQYQRPPDPYITLDASVPAGSTVIPIINSGDTIGDFEFQGLPDGIGLAPGPRRGTVDVYVAHEQTTVPFFGTADFENASVARLTLSTRGRVGAVLDASVALSPDLGYLRFCSAFMAGPAEGFDDYVFFTGEETDDIVDVWPGAEFGADPAIAPQRQGGYAVALDTVTGNSEPIAGMGRLNHENTIWLPGYSRLVGLTTDDTFNGPSSQLYMYLAKDQRGVFKDRGSLWAFRVTGTQDGKVNPRDPFNGANDYLDIRPGDDFRGEFIRVPRKIALGLTDEAPQAALENWSNANNVFQFIRLEDLAYDPDEPNVVYVADTGRSRVVPDPTTGRLVRASEGTGFADNGAIFRFEFDTRNPRKVTSFSMIAQGDDPALDAYVPFVSPDNVGMSSNSLMVQEDTDEASIWRHDLSTGAWAVVATVNDPDGESSGIVDASAWFGAGAWLLDVQAHGTFVREELQDDGTLLKLEDGQLMLLTIPGS